MTASAEEALAVMADRCPRLVVLDLLLPGMTGLEMLEIMRRQPALARTPVIISTSVPERAPRDVPVLAKPIDVDALCAWMRRSCQCGV